MVSLKIIGPALALSIALVTSAHAETMSTKLFESTTLITASHVDLETMNLAGVGTLTVKLNDLQWPDLLGSLSFTLFDATHVLGSYSLNNQLSGSKDFAINLAGTYYASIFATPTAGKLGGLYNAQIYFQPTPAPVSLPAAGWLLLSGIAGLAALQPKHKLSQMCA